MENEGVRSTADENEKARAETTKFRSMWTNIWSWLFKYPEDSPGPEAELPLEQEAEQPAQEQPEQQPETTPEDLEQCQRDEQDLKDAGYDPHDGQNSATKALCVTVSKQPDLRIIRLLLAKGADPTSCTQQHSGLNDSALHIAARDGYADVVGIFIESGLTEVDIVDDKGYTPFMWAALFGHEEIVRSLLAKGAKPNKENQFGDFPLNLAIKGMGKDHPVVHLLRENGAELQPEKPVSKQPLRQKCS